MEGARKNIRHPVEAASAKPEQIVKMASRLSRERGFD
jgi:hypothetical protein